MHVDYINISLQANEHITYSLCMWIISMIHCKQTNTSLTDYACGLYQCFTANKRAHHLQPMHVDYINDSLQTNEHITYRLCMWIISMLHCKQTSTSLTAYACGLYQ